MMREVGVSERSSGRSESGSQSTSADSQPPSRDRVISAYGCRVITEPGREVLEANSASPSPTFIRGAAERSRASLPVFQTGQSRTWHSPLTERARCSSPWMTSRNNISIPA